MCCRLFLGLMVSLYAIGFVGNASAESNETFVWYPVLAEPYSEVFEEILGGIQNGSGGAAIEVPLKPLSDLVQVVEKKVGSSKPVILLGHQAISLASQFDQGYQFIAGAAYDFSPKDNFVFISYHPSPKIIYHHLKSLFPKINVLYVVFSQQGNDWVKSVALSDARDSGIELVVIEKHNLRESAKAIRGVMEDINPETEAIWVVPDRAVIDDKVIVPYLLREAWKKKVVVISNSIAHVDRGMLFALYPDNVKLGELMVEISDQLVAETYKGPRVQTLNRLKYAINVRTAKHLGLDLDQADLSRYQLVFPQR